MLTSLIIYAIATAVALRYASPWLTSGNVAFAAGENKTFLWRSISVIGITAVYAVLSIALSIGAQFFAVGLVALIGKGLATAVVYELSFMAADVLILALSIIGVSKVMKNSLTAKTFGATISASLIITVLAIVGQVGVGVLAYNLAQ
ncbi:MAG: hypothetical protein K2Y39_02630 [Candidatus Obscuribacterales bacterium]|nr:hypothetical protein [Candidatus Obscuribacterales bacterium]